MESQPLVQVTPLVGKPEGFGRVTAKAANSDSDRSPTHRVPPKGKPLSEFQGRSDILVPTYLPSGFSYEHAAIRELPDRGVFLTFQAQDSGAVLNIRMLPKGIPAQLQVKEGSSKAVSIGNHQGYLLRGIWGQQQASDGSALKSGWIEDVALQLFFEHSGQVIALVAIPARFITEEELIKVAESLQPY
jgi:hypothetical protein